MKNQCDKILIVSTLWSGMESIFIEGGKTPTGMPAFFNELNSISRKNLSIDLVFVSDKKPLTYTPLYRNITIYHVPMSKNTKLGLIPVVFKLFYLTSKLIKNNKYKFLYGFGYFSSIVGIQSLINNVPNYRRLFGTFLNSEINHRKLIRHLKILIKHPLEYLSWVLPANALIVTDDGTCGDKVAEGLGVKSNFYFC